MENSLMNGNNSLNSDAGDTDKLCLNSGDVDLYTSLMSPSVLEAVKASDKRIGSDHHNGEINECISPPNTGISSPDHQQEYALKPSANDGAHDCTESNSVHDNACDAKLIEVISDCNGEHRDNAEDCVELAGDSGFADTTNCDTREISNVSAAAFPVEDGDVTDKHTLQHGAYKSEKLMSNATDDDEDEDGCGDCGSKSSEYLPFVTAKETDENCCRDDAELCGVKDSLNELEKTEAWVDNVKLSSMLTDSNCSAETTHSECINDEVETAKSVTTGKNTDDGRLVDKLECEADETKTASDDPDEKKLDSVAVCDTNSRCSNNGFSVATAPISTADVVVSSASSLSASTNVVMKAPSLSTLLSKVAVLSGFPSVMSTNDVAKPSQPPSSSSSVPSTLACSGGMRMMSKALQDVGLLLVSQRVFKDLANIQKRKLGSSTSDEELLQKLRTSHQNLVAKNRGLLTTEQKCWCGFRSESLNVIEAHRLECNFQGRCCMCKGEFTYRTINQIKRHLLKAHRKVGKSTNHVAGYTCAFCPIDYTTRFLLLRHMDLCRRKFSLSTNLAPKVSDKDIPITCAAPQPVKIPVVLSTSQISTGTQSTVTSISRSGVLPSVNLQLVPAPRKPAPGTQLIQIGKQFFTVVPPNTVVAAAVAPTRPSTVKVAQAPGKVVVDTPAQITPPVASSALPVVVNMGNQAPASRLPVPVVQSNLQYTVCPVCTAFVKDKAALLVHIHVAHGSTHKLCQYCCDPAVLFSSLVGLNLHILKAHTSECWICRGRFQPPEFLIHHIADRHKVTMFKMLQLRRCYLCPSVPSLSNYAAVEEHMMKQHSMQFHDTVKLWDSIINSSNADKDWYAKQNADGTLECPHCCGHFISRTFLYRHLHLEHNGKVVRMVQCCKCRKQMPSNSLLEHLAAAHTKKCSVLMSWIDMPKSECLFIPPVGTKRKKNRKGKLASTTHRVKRSKLCEILAKPAEMVVISDDDKDNDNAGVDDDDDDSDVASDDCVYSDDSQDEDFVSHSRANVQRTGMRTRASHRNSSVDEVHEVLESIVESDVSETVPRQAIGFTKTTRCAPVRPSAATHLCNGITEDEVEIIESIVPTISQLPRKPQSVKPSDGHDFATDAATNGKSGHAKCMDSSTEAHAKSDLGLVLTECQNVDRQQPSSESNSASVASCAQQLMARDQIMVDSVEEVMEIDGETVLIVQDNDDDVDEEEEGEGGQ